MYRIFAKVFNAKPLTIEQEKRFKGLLGRASDEDVALEAIELMFEEGVTYPTGKHLREAIERVQIRHALEEPRLDVREEIGYGDDYDPTYGYEDPMRWRGPAVTFRDWYGAQGPDMQARIRRVFPSLKVGL